MQLGVENWILSNVYKEVEQLRRALSWYWFYHLQVELILAHNFLVWYSVSWCDVLRKIALSQMPPTECTMKCCSVMNLFLKGELLRNLLQWLSFSPSNFRLLKNNWLKVRISLKYPYTVEIICFHFFLSIRPFIFYSFYLLLQMGTYWFIW